MISDLLHYSFLQNAVWAIILASLACGIIGAIIMEKRLVMMSGGIAHTAFGGIGMGYYFKFEPVIGALLVSVLAALGISAIGRKVKTNTDILIGMCWSLGMAVGILFIAFTPGYPPDMTSYLFGDILTVSRSDLKLIGVLDLIVCTVIWAYYIQFKAYLFDEEFARVLGVPVIYLEYLLYIMIALTAVTLIRVVGIILSLALLTVPPSIARQFSSNLRNIMLTSFLLGMVFCLLGLWVSYELLIPSGSAIIITSISAYLLISLFKKILKSKTSAHDKKNALQNVGDQI